MEVNIEGVSPASYQWYFEGAPIAGANQRVYNIVNASVEDAVSYTHLDVYKRQVVHAHARRRRSLGIDVLLERNAGSAGLLKACLLYTSRCV